MKAIAGNTSNEQIAAQQCMQMAVMKIAFQIIQSFLKVRINL